MSVGGLTISKQEMCFANETLWEGDGVTSGIMGFAYPSLTAAYNESTYDSIPYLPWIQNVFAENLTTSAFALALERDIDLGVSGILGIGGLPEGASYTGDWAVTDILIAEEEDDTATASNYSFYTIQPDGWIVKPANTECDGEGSYLAWADYSDPGQVTESNGTYTLVTDFNAIVGEFELP